MCGNESNSPETNRRSENGSSRRDIRYDVVRGFALWIIYSDHIPGNALKQFTPAAFGFSDMAEVFVFTSGCVGGIAYAKRLDRSGFGNAQVRSLTRALQIYLAWVLTVIAYTCLVAGLREAFPLAYIPGESLLAEWQRSPVDWLLDVVLLRTTAGGLTILSLYLCFVIFLPAITFLARRQPLAVIAASIALYAGVQLAPATVRMPSPWDESWYFNPFSWQVVFIAGVILGGHPESRLWIPSTWPVVILAIALLEVGIAAKTMAAESDMPLVGKRELQAVRLLHFAAVAIVGRLLLTSLSPLLTTSWIAPLAICGRCSLIVYCTGVMLSCGASTLLDLAHYSTAAQVAVNVGGYVLMTLVAAIWLKCCGRARKPKSSSDQLAGKDLSAASIRP